MARTRYQYGDVPTPLRQLPAAALRAVLREGYTGQDLRADLLAGLVVGVVALPLAMAIAIAVGVAPQRGLYTTMVAGFAVALLGGSRTQISGPSAAFIIVLAPIFGRYGLSGLLMVGLLGGLILIAIGLMRLGGLIVYIPHPVTTGFTAGTATLIATLQLKDFLGLQVAGQQQHVSERIAAIIAARHTLAWPELMIGGLTLALLIGLPRLTRRIPAPVVVIPLAALLSAALARWLPGFHVDTIASRFQSELGGQLVHGIPPLPPWPLLPWAEQAGAPPLTFATLRELVPAAFAIAMLGSIESLLSAVVADGMARTRHDPDAELVALGVGNLLCAFLGALPASGAIARTATNVRSGARSPIAAMTHALTILLAVLALAPLIGMLPMAALAALLLIVAWNMSELRHAVHTVKVAPRSDVAVLLICYGLTVAVDMVVAVSVGVVLAALLFMRHMAEATKVKLVEASQAGSSRAVPDGVFLYDIAGPLFFGAAQKALGTLGSIKGRAKVVVVGMAHVPVMDATGLVAFESALSGLAAAGCKTIITGLQPQPTALLRRSAAATDAAHVLLSDNTDEALRLAERLLGRVSEPALADLARQSLTPLGPHER